jgi:DNA-binding XRE family transcriptional regulator
MAKPVIITSPSGDRLAVIPLSEYERLVDAAEDAADVAAYDEVKRKLATGEDELIPDEVVGRLIAGENKVRVWREHRGMTATALADAAGISTPYLSQIESGKRDGSIDAMKRIANALGITVDDLV